MSSPAMTRIGPALPPRHGRSWDVFAMVLLPKTSSDVSRSLDRIGFSLDDCCVRELCREPRLQEDAQNGTDRGGSLSRKAHTLCQRSPQRACLHLHIRTAEGG